MMIVRSIRRKKEGKKKEEKKEEDRSAINSFYLKNPFWEYTQRGTNIKHKKKKLHHVPLVDVSSLQSHELLKV